MKSFSRYIFNIAPRVVCWGFAAAVACFTAATQAQVPVFTNVWVLPAGYHPDLTNRSDATASTSRGVGISPVTTNVLFSSTYANTNGGSAHVATLSFESGSNYLAQLNGTGISAGICLLMNVRVSDDGSVYACNRRDGGVNTFTIYRWPSETDTATAPTKVVDLAFTQRMGDHMDVRGSGTNTEIVVIGSAASAANVSTNFVIFRPTDAALTNFTNFSITIPGNTASSIVSAHGVTFEGTNNAIYVLGGSPLAVRRVSYDPVTLTATVTRTNATDSASCRALKYYSSTNGIGLLASVQYSTTLGSAQLARVFQIPSGPTAALASVLSSNFPAPFTGSQNANGLGQVDARNGYFVFGAPGYGLTFFKVAYVDTVPPTVGTISGGGTYVAGHPVTLSSSVSGSAPLYYQWYFDTNTPISGAITNSYSIPSVQTSNAGRYSLVVTNLYGVSTSSYAGLTVLPAGYSSFATNLWTLASGSRPYLTTGDTQRGLAYDPVRNKLIVPSRSTTNGIHVLDAVTGADENELDIGIILANPPAPGTFMFNACGVADDGVVYVGNLITSGASDQFTIYRWADSSSSSPVGQAYLGNPAVTRLGDTMAVRGAAENTEILCSFRTGTNLALFLPNDGLGQTYNVNILSVTNLPEDAITNGFAGLGLAFGPGNTFWAKSSGFNLRLVAYDTNDMTAHVVATYTNLPISEAPLGADNINGYIATVAFGQTPQNLSIWDIARGEPDAIQLDRELFGSSNANLNGTGAVAVDVAGGRIFALDSNNGLIALAYPPKMFIAPAVQGGIVTWTGPGTLQSSTNLVGTYNDVLGASSPHTNSGAGEVYFRVKR